MTPVDFRRLCRLRVVFVIWCLLFCLPLFIYFMFCVWLVVLFTPEQMARLVIGLWVIPMGSLYMCASFHARKKLKVVLVRSSSRLRLSRSFFSFVCHEPTTSQQRSPCKFSFRFVRALFLLFPFFFNLVTHMGRNRKRLYLTPKEKGEIGRGREMLFGEGLHYTISTTLQEHDQEVWRWAAHKWASHCLLYWISVNIINTVNVWAGPMMSLSSDLVYPCAFDVLIRPLRSAELTNQRARFLYVAVLLSITRFQCYRVTAMRTGAINGRSLIPFQAHVSTHTARPRQWLLSEAFRTHAHAHNTANEKHLEVRS